MKMSWMLYAPQVLVFTNIIYLYPSHRVYCEFIYCQVFAVLLYFVIHLLFWQMCQLSDVSRLQFSAMFFCRVHLYLFWIVVENYTLSKELCQCIWRLMLLSVMSHCYLLLLKFLGSLYFHIPSYSRLAWSSAGAPLGMIAAGWIPFLLPSTVKALNLLSSTRWKSAEMIFFNCC